MVQGPSPEAIEAIRNPSTLDAQISALKLLKNDIAGHDQRKELLVRQNLLPTLVDILSTNNQATNLRAEHGLAAQLHPHSRLSQEDDARLQSLLILGSVANAGPTLIPPLHSSGVVEKLLDVLQSNSPSRLVNAALQALHGLLSTWCAHEEGTEHYTFDIITTKSVDTFISILRQPLASRKQFGLAIEIVGLSARCYKTREVLTNSGTLDVLASLLASHSVACKFFDYHHPNNPATEFPQPPPIETIPSICDAIAAIIGKSQYCALSFILSPPVQHLFTFSISLQPNRGTWPHSSNPQLLIEPLLPLINIPASKTVSFSNGSRAFPAFGGLQVLDRRALNTTSPSLQGFFADHAVAVCGWLLVLARSLEGAGRLSALHVLALVNNAIEKDSQLFVAKAEDVRRARDRERQLALLAVPLSVNLVRTATESKAAETTAEKLENQTISEKASDVLALLTQSSAALQNTAVDAGALKSLCPLLKKSFDTVTLSQPMWSARSATSAKRVDSALPETSRVGSERLPPEIIHAMRCRRSALEAIAALATKDEVIRKQIAEAGVISSFIDSLKPYPDGYFHCADGVKRAQMTPRDGSTNSVILAACHAAQTMSRSVSLLRTSLIDAGIALPLFELLKHLDTDIKIAATDVCCNLVLDFSPMREDLLQAGVIKLLAEHARQSELSLRLSSLWALKHLVLQAPKDIKLQCLEELGTGWLVGAIQGEQQEVRASVTPNGGIHLQLSTSNAIGEQVDLLNPSSMDVDEPMNISHDSDGEEEEEQDEEDEDGEVLYDERSSTHYQASQIRSTLSKPPPAFDSLKHLASLRDIENDRVFQASRSDIAIQEQALDFVRNFLHGEETAEMFEHLLEEIGSTKIFALLTEKLSPITQSSITSRTSRAKANGASKVYLSTEVILSTIHVITHIANGEPKHKSLLVAQRAMLTNWIPHFNHADPRVRTMSVWAVCSMTWIEDESDRQSAKQRVQELRSLGIEAVVRSLTNDPALDVRERVKTALRQMEAL